MSLPSLAYEKFLTKSEERQYLKAAQAGDRSALERLVVTNQFLVHNIARGYTNAAGMPDYYDDLFQEGNIGLITAIKKFDLRRRVRLSTYAVPWIRQHVGRTVAKNIYSIPLPEDLFYAKRRAEKKLAKNPNARLTSSEKNAMSDNILTLRLPIEPQTKDDDHFDTKDSLVASTENKQLAEELNIDDYESYFRGTPGLTRRDHHIVSDLLGIYDVAKTVVQVANELGMSQTSVRRDYNRALIRIKNAIHWRSEKKEVDFTEQLWYNRIT